MKPDLYRVAFLMADGRKVYLAIRGRIWHLGMDEAAEQARITRELAADVCGDPWVYAEDLRGYWPRSTFLEALAPFVMVRAVIIEPASSPIDPAAFILGGGLASEAGRFSRTER